MTEEETDRMRASAAVKAIIGDRDAQDDMSAIMVTLETAVTLCLLALMQMDARRAVGMLNEGLVPGVEIRIAMYEERKRNRG